MQTEKTGVIYRIYHKESMKSYIGKSVSPERRIYDHLNGHSGSPALLNAIKKYDKGAFCVEILESDVPESWLSKMEILYIRFFNTKAPNGYNLTNGGEGASGAQVSLKTRQKLSEIRKGRKCTPETRQKISEANKGKKRSPEARRKMSNAKKGRTSPMKGKKRSRKFCKKNSESKKVEFHGIRAGKTLIQMSPCKKCPKPIKVKSPH